MLQQAAIGVNAHRAKALAGETLGKADAALIRVQTGFAIGGVSPAGHLAPIIAFMDPYLMTFGRCIVTSIPAVTGRASMMAEECGWGLVGRNSELIQTTRFVPRIHDYDVIPQKCEAMRARQPRRPRTDHRHGSASFRGAHKWMFISGLKMIGGIALQLPD